MNADDQVQVQHNAAKSRFEIEVDGHLCVADYEMRDERLIFTHTFVSPELRGRGIAEKLVRFALEHARTQGIKVTPACSYVEKFIQRHAEFQPLLAV